MLDVELSSAPQFFGLRYPHMVIDEDNQIVAFSDRVDPRVKKMSLRAIDRSIGDRSSQLFLLHILPLCNVWQHMNTCASRVMQVYASHTIALNKSRPKILAHVSLNANCFFIFTSGCLLLFTFSFTFMAQTFYFNILQ